MVSQFGTWNAGPSGGDTSGRKLLTTARKGTFDHSIGVDVYTRLVSALAVALPVLDSPGAVLITGFSRPLLTGIRASFEFFATLNASGGPPMYPDATDYQAFRNVVLGRLGISWQKLSGAGDFGNLELTALVDQPITLADPVDFSEAGTELVITAFGPEPIAILDPAQQITCTYTLSLVLEWKEGAA